MPTAARRAPERPYANRTPHEPGHQPHQLAPLVLQAMRPRQWLKNLFVLAPVLFSGNIFALPLLGRAAAAVGCFCGLAGAVYLVNDLCDRKRDALHPLNKKRPIASGALSPAAAVGSAGLVGLSCLAVAAGLGWEFLATCLVYVLLMLAYSFSLKNVVLVDVGCIASGFVLRAVAGSVVIGVPISPWLFICTALVSLFLALGKRRAELTRLSEEAGNHRPVLHHYNQALLDQLISVTTAGSLVSYLLYCVLSETAAAHHGLLLTAPFVGYGLFRYLYCIYQKGAGGSPEDIVLKDKVFLGSSVAYAVAVVVVLYVT
jgi:4-hydroxybenzoate polyprenyltransferase